MSVIDRSDCFCIVGAGSSGLAAAKNLRQLGIAVDVLERQDEIGGNWCYGKPNSRVYASTHTISSKRLTEFTDFKMPAHYPPFPHHSQVLEYLRAYAAQFGLFDAIEFETTIERIEPAGREWFVTLAGGQRRRYAGVVVANGHNWDPRWPDFPGTFAGRIMHAAEYKTPDVLRGQRVLVVGAGNTGCDIAVESALHAAQTFHSTRRGYHFIPKFLFGRPSDVMHEKLLRLGLPHALRRLIVRSILRLAVGDLRRYGLPEPDHELFASHPIINSQLPYYVAHGRIVPKPNVAHLCGRHVRFDDGSEEAIDLIVYATGYRTSMPFLDPQYLNVRDGRPHLYLNVFHPHYDNLYFIGLIQPDSGQFGLVDYQSQLMANFVVAARTGSPAAEALRRAKAAACSVAPKSPHRYLDTPRNVLEVEHFTYRHQLQRELARLRAA
jgi:cation diffusion facilitator CzcD-associated flavoprotein CzcO